MNRKRIHIVLSVVLILGILWLLWGNLTVGLTKLTITEETLPMAFHGLKIAHVSDLHNSHLWKQTIRQLQKAQPDIICITGDMVDCSHTNVQVALDFAEEAVKIAPCYYITGNHELNLAKTDYETLITGLKHAGVYVLEDEAVTLERGDAQLRLVGTDWGSTQYQGELSQFDGYKILLAHDPKHFESYAQAGYDLVLTGHIHGGQFRLPFVGGLYGPGQGLFPQYDSGVYSNNTADMVVSRGIGNSVFPVRFANRPEVILITLKA